MSDFNEEQQPARRGMLATTIVVLFIALVVLAGFMAYSHLPRAGGNDSTFSALTPTAAQTNPVDSIDVNRAITFNGVNITVMKVGEASSFSDDKRQLGKYVVRVYAQQENRGQNPVGIDYDGLARLILPDGKEIAPQGISLTPVILPNQQQAGYLDFPVSQQVDVSSLSLRMGKKVEVSFGA